MCSLCFFNNINVKPTIQWKTVLERKIVAIHSLTHTNRKSNRHTYIHFNLQTHTGQRDWRGLNEFEVVQFINAPIIEFNLQAPVLSESICAPPDCGQLWRTACLTASWVQRVRTGGSFSSSALFTESFTGREEALLPVVKCCTYFSLFFQVPWGPPSLRLTILLTLVLLLLMRGLQEP